MLGITVGSRKVPGKRACDKRQQHNNDNDDGAFVINISL